MPPELTKDEANRLVMAKQRLAGERTRDPVETAGYVAGVIGQSPTMYLSLLARVDGLTIPMVEDILFESRQLGRLPCMRSAVYALPSSFLPVAYQATRDRLRRTAMSLIMQADLEPDAYEDLKARLLEAIPANTSFTTQTVINAIGGAADDATVAAAIAAMTCEGVLTRSRSKGGWRSNLYEYARFTDWFPGVDLESVTPEQAKVRLARRYLDSFGPTTAKDYAWWAGLPLDQANEAFEKLSGVTTPVKIEGLPDGYVMVKGDEKKVPEPGAAALLPAQDTFLLGYYDRTRYSDPARAQYIWDKFGNAAPTIVVDGQIAGIWDFETSRRSLSVRYSPLLQVQDFEKRIEPAVDKLADMVELTEVRLERTPLPEPLVRQPKGSYEHPLKNVKLEKLGESGTSGSET